MHHLLLVAHRGDPAHAPENTVASFRSAIARGAKAVEMDVRRTADRVWVVFHDSTLNRMTGRRGRVAQTRWVVLKELESAGEPIPSLEQALDFCRRREAKVFLDVKVRRDERSLFKAIRRSRWLSRATIGAGNVPTLRRWKRLLRERPLFWVTGYRAAVISARIRQTHRLGLTGLAVYRRWVTKGAVSQVHAAGLKLYAWTARSQREIRRLADCGVDGIMSEVWPPPRSI